MANPARRYLTGIILLMGLSVASLWAQTLGVPFRFEENVGQRDTDAKFIGLANGYRSEMRRDEVVIRGGGAPIHMSFAGGRKSLEVQASEPMAALTDSYDGRTGRFFSHIRNYQRLTYPSVYPGVDVVFRGSDRALEFDFILKPHSDLKSIAVDFSGQTGLAINSDGSLVLQTSRGEMRFLPPVVYQDSNGKRIPIKARYKRSGPERVGFDIDNYNAEQELVIDPRLVFGKYLGSMGSNLPGEIPSKVVIGPNGNAYGLWTEEDAQDNFEVYLSIVRFDGNQPVYFYNVGPLNSYPMRNPGQAIAVDTAGNPAVLTTIGYSCGACVTFTPSLSALPHGTQRHDDDVAIVKFGSGAFSTFLGGQGNDYGTSIAFDPQNNIYIAGYTSSSDFPTLNGIQSAEAGGWDGFLTKIDPTGTQLLYSTLLGGSQDDTISALALDATGNIYVAGTTASTDFPTQNAMQAANGGGSCTSSSNGAATPCTDMFIAKLNPAGTALLFSTYVGGAGSDSASQLSISGDGSVFVHGSGAAAFPITKVSGFNAADVLLKLDSSGGQLDYSMRFSGAKGITVDSAGNLYVAGTSATDAANPAFPVINSFRLNSAGPDMTVTKLDGNGNLIFSTLVGGMSSYHYPGATALPEQADAIAVDAAGRMFVIGTTYTSDFPVTDGSSAEYNIVSDHDAAVFVLDPSSGTDVSPRYSRIENDYPQIQYTGTWNPHATQYDSGGSSVLSMDSSASFTLNFTGTNVSWYGCRDEWAGIAKVTLDGVVQGDIDTYMTPGKCPSLIWSASSLGSGTHILLVQVEGKKNSASAGSWVWLDKVEVTSAGDASFAAPTSGGGGSSGGTGDTGSGSTGGSGSGSSSGGTSNSTYTRVEQTDASVTYQGSWYADSNGALSGGSAALAIDPGSRATFSFTGTSARWIGFKDQWSGIARVYVDGVLQTQVDLYAAGQQSQIVAYTTPTLASGNHTLTIEVAGTRNPSSSSNWIWVDAFEVAGGSGTGAGTGSSGGSSTSTYTRVEQTATSVTYQGTWFADSNSALSGGSAALAIDPGSRATFSFSGTSARWIGFKDQWSGIANIYVDGVLQTQADLYMAGQQSQAIVYTTPALASGNHTLTVEVTGTRNASSSSNWIWVDSFEYLP